ncbi:MAG: ATP-binding protein [Eubacterium sp.]|uniref:ATP-binding protein n=1 Tax=Eubacterium sp. TaxID=142586 RepID=UPI0025B90953|nr:ATP-binding protein [Eubacterium sp.]
MAYSNEIYNKAKRILEKRHDAAVMEADIRSAQIREEIPEINKIQAGLQQVGLEISQLFFYKQNTDEKVAELRARSEALVEERSRLLKANGYRENAMKPQFVCEMCEDKGFINGRMCTCHKQLLKDLMRKEVSCFAPLDKCTFDNFVLDYYSEQPMENAIIPRQRAEKIFDTCRKYAQNFSLNSKNLIFFGGAGLGKTHLSLAIANVVINKGFNVCYGTSQNICDDLQSEQFGRTDNINYTKNQVLGCDLLVLDDLGTEIDNQYSIATVYNIVNSRLLAGRPTIISTNYTFSKLEEKYDKRITSRLTGEYVPFYFIGNDIRNL